MTGAPSPNFEIPPALNPVFQKFFASEYAYFTPKGEPLCWPVSPYWYPDRGVLAIATGLAYPNKAEYPKRNPRVALFFSNPMFSGLEAAPKVLVQGDATVIDEDIQENTDRYVTEMRHKFPQARVGLNTLTVKFLDFYLPRLWVEITPVRIFVWHEGRDEPEIFGRDPGDTSDQEQQQITDHSPVGLGVLLEWIRRLGEAVIAVKGPNGYPNMVRTRVWAEDGDKIGLENSPGTGAAALTFHYARLGGVRFNTQMARGWVEETETGFVFRTRRIVGMLGADQKTASGLLPALGTLAGSVFPFSAIPRIADLRRRLHKELARRGQAMPKLRVPR